MSSEVEKSLRDYSEHLRQSSETITPAEIYARAASEPPASERRRDHQSKARWLAVAASVAVVIGAALVYVRNGGENDAIVTTSDSSAPITSDPEPSPASLPAPTTPPPPVTETVTTEPIIEPPPTTIAPDGPVTIADVHRQQREALRRLTGFSATVSNSPISPPDGDAQSTPIRYTLLADGSFYATTGPDAWGSYDPATKIVLGAFRDLNGVLAYQEIVGQPDNSLPVSIIGGFDPTRLVGDGSALTDVTIKEIEVDGRASWEVTIVDTFNNRPFGQDAGQTDTAGETVQTTIQVVDQQTGLIVRSTSTSSDPSVGSRDSELSDIEIVDQMPPEFPGTFPAGAVVDRSGDPDTARPATLDDFANLFGPTVPVPAGLINGVVGPASSTTITINEYDAGLEGDDSGPNPSATQLIADFHVREGFVTTTVSISALAIEAGQSAPPNMTLIDGFACTDIDGDELCDSTNFGEIVEPETVERGALEGTSVLLIDDPLGTAASIAYGPIQLYVYGADITTIRAILNSFEFLTPT